MKLGAYVGGGKIVLEPIRGAVARHTWFEGRVHRFPTSLRKRVYVDMGGYRITLA